jgi:hypothetical protein
LATFKVSTSDLRSLTSQLSALVGELGQAAQFSPDYGAAGHPRVESGLQAFFSDWSDGLDKIESNINELTQRLSGASDKYDGIDQSVASAFQLG